MQQMRKQFLRDAIRPDSLGAKTDKGRVNPPADCPLFRPGEKPKKGWTCEKCQKKCPQKGGKDEYGNEGLRNE